MSSSCSDCAYVELFLLDRLFSGRRDGGNMNDVSQTLNLKRDTDDLYSSLGQSNFSAHFKSYCFWFWVWANMSY